jgi:hypothetical protein
VQALKFVRGIPLRMWWSAVLITGHIGWFPLDMIKLGGNGGTIDCGAVGGFTFIIDAAALSSFTSTLVIGYPKGKRMLLELNGGTLQ